MGYHSTPPLNCSFTFSSVRGRCLPALLWSASSLHAVLIRTREIACHFLLLVISRDFGCGSVSQLDRASRRTDRPRCATHRTLRTYNQHRTYICSVLVRTSCQYRHGCAHQRGIDHFGARLFHAFQVEQLDLSVQLLKFSQEVYVSVINGENETVAP